jgi:uncharacterized protein (DUF2267 family)
MPATGLEVFDTTIQKTNALLKDIETQLGWTDRGRSYSALRAVLHTLRDRLTVDEAADFAAQLPLLTKGIFYDGWRPATMPRKLSVTEFSTEIAQALPFNPELKPTLIASAVLWATMRYVSEGEIEDVLSILPLRLREELEQALQP